MGERRPGESAPPPSQIFHKTWNRLQRYNWRKRPSSEKLEMESRVFRVRKLAGVRLSISELEAFVSKLRAHFQQEDSPLRIEVSLPNEQIRFYSIGELRGWTESARPQRLSDIDVVLGADPTRIEIRGDESEIVAIGVSEAWCAAAVEESDAFLRSFRVWHVWMPRLLVIPLFLVSFALCCAVIGTDQTEFQFNAKAARYAAMILLTLLFGFLAFNRGTVFPSLTVVTRAREAGWLKTHLPELSLLVAFLSFAASVVSLLLKK
jgi:hypothetical protein